MFDNLIYLYRHAMNLMEGPSDGEPSSFAACQKAYHTTESVAWGYWWGITTIAWDQPGKGGQACD